MKKINRRDFFGLLGKGAAAAIGATVCLYTRLTSSTPVSGVSGTDKVAGCFKGEFTPWATICYPITSRKQ